MALRASIGTSYICVEGAKAAVYWGWCKSQILKADEVLSRDNHYTCREES